MKLSNTKIFSGGEGGHNESDNPRLSVGVASDPALPADWTRGSMSARAFLLVSARGGPSVSLCSPSSAPPLPETFTARGRSSLRPRVRAGVKESERAGARCPAPNFRHDARGDPLRDRVPADPQPAAAATPDGVRGDPRRAGRLRGHQGHEGTGGVRVMHGLLCAPVPRAHEPLAASGTPCVVSTRTFSARPCPFVPPTLFFDVLGEAGVHGLPTQPPTPLSLGDIGDE